MNTVKLLNDKNMQERMIENQSKIINRKSAKDLVNFVLNDSKMFRKIQVN